MKVRVEVVVTIEDQQGRTVWSLTEVSTQNNGDNPRFLGSDTELALGTVTSVVRDTMDKRFGSPPK